MIKIIKNGQKDFVTKCRTCGCEFSYQLIDINLGSVICPYCGHYAAHKEFGEPHLATDINAIPCKFPQQPTADWIAPNVTIISSNADLQYDSLQTIHDLCIGYGGFNTVEGLKSLIDDICAIADEVVCKEKEE